MKTTDFDTAWRRLEKLGACDGFGGMEYRRVLREWQLFVKVGISGELETFIRTRANLSPLQN